MLARRAGHLSSWTYRRPSLALPSRPTTSGRSAVSASPLPTSHASTSAKAHVGTASEASSRALQVTDPLLMYRAMVASGQLASDQEQLRAVIALRNLHKTLLDYRPPPHLLSILSTHSSSSVSQNRSEAASDHGHPIERGKESALVRWLSEEESIRELDTPKGMMLIGPPGTGKSLLLNLFYHSLPTPHKVRRHYHHLLLEIYRDVWSEAERRRLSARGGANVDDEVCNQGKGSGLEERGGGDAKARAGGLERFKSLFRFGRSSRERPLQADPALSSAYNPEVTLPLHAASRLFLRHGWLLVFDEVQLVDIASANLIRRVLEAYWKLGGVVVGSSNRLPEDLYASNVQRNQLLSFLTTLQERCPVHEMRTTHDWRRGSTELSNEGVSARSSSPESGFRDLDRRYFLAGEETGFEKAVSAFMAGRSGKPASVEVYGRRVHVPIAVPCVPTSDSAQGGGELSPPLSNLARFRFQVLCDAPLGAADYLTIASTYETIAVDGVPQMRLKDKNVARRWITFLDAAYEAGSRLIVLAATCPDDLFFPDARPASSSAIRARTPEAARSATTAGAASSFDDVVESARGAASPFTQDAIAAEEAMAEWAGRTSVRSDEDERRRRGAEDELTNEQLMNAETFGEVSHDVEERFRPNMSSYQEGMTGGERRGVDDDETVSERGAPRREGGGFGGDWRDLAFFTGEDERFAYARAVSRLHEMSSPRWEARRRWQPFAEGEMRWWDGGVAVGGPSSAAAAAVDAERGAGVKRQPWKMTDQFAPENRPRLSPDHIWGVREDWGKRAGRWGKGAKAYADGDGGDEGSSSRRRPD